MISDAFEAVSVAQTVTSTAVSTSSIDLKAARHLSPGRRVEFVTNVVTTAASAGGAAVLHLEIVTADNEALTTNLTVVGRRSPIAQASLVAGSSWPITLDWRAAQPRRYLGVRYRVTGENLTAGAFTTRIADALADGRTIYPGSPT